MNRCFLGVLAALAAGWLGAGEVVHLEQNFDALPSGSVSPVWEGKTVSGGVKVYKPDNFYIVDSPSVSGKSFKACRESGGSAIFFRDQALPADRDAVISFSMYLPGDKGAFGLWFTDEKGEAVGGILIQPGMPVKGYIPHATDKMVWMQTAGLNYPVNRFARINVKFNAADRNYFFEIIDNGMTRVSRKYPCLNNNPLYGISVLTIAPEGCYALIDDLKITYSTEPSQSANDPELVSEVISRTSDLEITHSKLRLGPIAERKAPNNDVLRYGVIFPMQIAPDTAALLVNRGIYATGFNYDSEDGSDIFIVRDLNDLATAEPIPVNRSGAGEDIMHPGKVRYLNRYPIIGGFVPLGAKVNGKPHPAAGTGFGMSLVLSHPLNNGSFDWRDGNISSKRELYQFAYDGREFKITGKKEIHDGNLMPMNEKYHLHYGGMSIAIPDGEDLLMPVQATSIENPHQKCCGVSRWRYVDGEWKVVDFTPVAFCDAARENSFYDSSLVRDAGGDLVFAARDDGRQNPEKPHWGVYIKQDLNVWYSPDQGKTWEHRLRVPMVRTGPMVLGRALDGTLFLMSNPIYPGMDIYAPRMRSCFWQLSEDYRSVFQPSIIRDANAEFQDNGTVWYIDHPNSTILQLNGKLLNVVSYRVRDPHLFKGKPITAASPESGAYVEEMISKGKPIPIWEF